MIMNLPAGNLGISTASRRKSEPLFPRIRDLNYACLSALFLEEYPMKNKRVLGSIGTLLILSLFAAVLTLVLPLRENSADGVHDCIEAEAVITRNADGHIIGVDLKVDGRIIFHHQDGHQPHPFDCDQPR